MPERSALITALILDRPMCLDCIATRSRTTTAEAQSAVQRIVAVLELHRETGRCRTCGITEWVLSVERPRDAGPQRSN